ncbi:hypothetical protein P5V15_008974 [Pogonomyrmex californicus]
MAPYYMKFLAAKLLFLRRLDFLYSFSAYYANTVHDMESSMYSQTSSSMNLFANDAPVTVIFCHLSSSFMSFVLYRPWRSMMEYVK